ncbi:MAG: endo-1,4-beta-xylanase, partial [Verrucomicrobiota bacterium]
MEFLLRNHWLRRTLILFLLFVSVGIVDAESLQEAAAHFPGLRVGAAVKPPDSVANAAYANTLRLQLNASPENATKWAATQPAQYTYGWTDADAIAAFGRAGGQQMRGHTLVWHNSIPTWLTGGGFTTNQIRDFLFHHIDTVVGRYRGDAFCWDVVNEAFNDNGTLRSDFWYDNPGIGYAANGTRYIEEAFKRAHAADPSAKLIYNDYSIEPDNAKSDAVYAMAQDFLSRGVPLDGIGFQMHISGLDYNSLRSNFKRFNDLGLELHITEMDVRIPVDGSGVATQANLDTQAEVYWNVLGVGLGQPNFKVFQTWGFADNDSWIPGFYPGFGAALPFDKNYQKKPAYWAIWNALANQAEKLPVLNYSSGDSTNTFSQDTLSAGAGMQLQADGTNDFMTLGLAVPFAGPWDVKVG